VNQIGNKKEFIEWLTSSDPEFEEKRYIATHYHPKDEMVYLDGLELLNLTIRDKHFECTEFKNCKFENCDFTNTYFASSTLENCHFKDCTFTWSKFLDVDLFTCQFEACTILGLELSDAVLKKTLFINCGEVLDLSIRGSRERNVSFINCYLQHLDIEPISEEDSEKIEFVDCLINESSFP
jgi:fluoroquinolone resistance protein